MPRVAVVGATGAVGRVMIDLLLERGFDDVRAFASARSAGTQVRGLRDEEMKVREETRKILELPELPVSATCVRVPVPVGHAESVWIETEKPIAPERARELLSAARSVRVEDFPTPGKAAGRDEALVGRIRRDAAAKNGLSLHLACDNLRKGAALNGIQVAELVLAHRTVAA